MSTEALDALDHIRRSPGLFAGQFPQHVMDELRKADLVTFYYEGAAGFMGLARVRANES